MDSLLTKLKILIEKNDDDANASIIESIKNLDVYTLIYPHGENLLHWAGAFNNVQIIEHLLANKKIHINLENYRGATALYYAAMKNSKDSCDILIKYNANPSIRSGFSGLMPEDVTTDDAVKNIVAIDKTLKNNLFVYYKYRLYMFWLSNLNYLNNKYKHTISDMITIPNAIEIFENNGIKSLADKCQEIYDDYLNVVKLFKENKLNKMCLTCNKTSILKRCSGCKKVWFCNKECQLIANKLHKYDCS